MLADVNKLVLNPVLPKPSTPTHFCMNWLMCIFFSEKEINILHSRIKIDRKDMDNPGMLLPLFGTQ